MLPLSEILYSQTANGDRLGITELDPALITLCDRNLTDCIGKPV